MPRHTKVTFGRQKSQLLRPKKSESRKRQRLKVWRKRLVKLGLTAEQADNLQYAAARTLLKRPLRTAAAAAKAKQAPAAKAKRAPKAKKAKA